MIWSILNYPNTYYIKVNKCSKQGCDLKIQAMLSRSPQVTLGAFRRGMNFNLGFSQGWYNLGTETNLFFYRNFEVIRTYCEVYFSGVWIIEEVLHLVKGVWKDIILIIDIHYCYALYAIHGIQPNYVAIYIYILCFILFRYYSLATP